MAISAVGARSRVIARALSSSLLGRGVLPTSRRASCINRLPLVSGTLLSALPLHSAIASARLRSAIAPESQSWGLIPQGYCAMLGWRAAGARAVLRRLGAVAAAAEKQDGRVFAASYSSSSRAVAPFGLGQYTNLLRAHTCTSRGVPSNFHQLIHNDGISTTRNLLAADNAVVPVSSPLTSPLGDAEETDKKGAVVKKLKVQAIKKDIKQSPKKVNLVAKLVRGMRVEDALLQLQVTVKRAAKTLYQVIHSARANAAHNHGLDPDKLLVEEAFVGKGLYLKRLSYHAKGRCGVMERPRCRLTVVVREATAEEEAKIAKLRVSNYKKLTRKEKQLMPHRLIEVSPRWARKAKDEAGTRA